MGVVGRSLDLQGGVAAVAGFQLVALHIDGSFSHSAVLYVECLSLEAYLTVRHARQIGVQLVARHRGIDVAHARDVEMGVVAVYLLHMKRGHTRDLQVEMVHVELACMKRAHTAHVQIRQVGSHNNEFATLVAPISPLVLVLHIEASPLRVDVEVVKFARRTCGGYRHVGPLREADGRHARLFDPVKRVNVEGTVVVGAIHYRNIAGNHALGAT